MANIQRRKTVTCSINGVRVGSDAPVVVQSMTNTDTADIASTVKQVAALARAGSELVRVTVNNEQAAAAMVSGMPRSFIVSSQMIPSVPSAPMNRCRRS